MSRRRSRWWVVALVAVLLVVAVGGAFAFLRWREPSPSPEAFCQRITDARGLGVSFATLDADAIDREVASLRAAAEVAPPEVSSDVATVLALTEEIARAVADNPSSPDEAITNTLRERRDQLPAVTEAGQAMERYTAATCGFELG